MGSTDADLSGGSRNIRRTQAAQDAERSLGVGTWREVVVTVATLVAVATAIFYMFGATYSSTSVTNARGLVERTTETLTYLEKTGPGGLVGLWIAPGFAVAGWFVLRYRQDRRRARIALMVGALIATLMVIGAPWTFLYYVPAALVLWISVAVLYRSSSEVGDLRGDPNYDEPAPNWERNGPESP